MLVLLLPIHVGFNQIPHQGAYCDLMWSDPEDIPGWGVSPRGAGFLFGYDATNEVNSPFSVY